MRISADLVVSLRLLSRVEGNVAEFTVQRFTQFPQPQRVLLLLHPQWRALVLGMLAGWGRLTREGTVDEAGHRGWDEGRSWGPRGHLRRVWARSRKGGQWAGREGESASSGRHYGWGNQCLCRVQRWRPQRLCEVHGRRHYCLCVIYRWGQQRVCHWWGPQRLSRSHRRGP